MYVEVIWPATLCYCFPQLNLCLPLLLLLSVDDEYCSGGTADIFDDEDEDEDDGAKAVLRVYKPETLVTRSFVRSLCVS